MANFAESGRRPWTKTTAVTKAASAAIAATALPRCTETTASALGPAEADPVAWLNSPALPRLSVQTEGPARCCDSKERAASVLVQELWVELVWASGSPLLPGVFGPMLPALPCLSGIARKNLCPHPAHKASAHRRSARQWRNDLRDVFRAPSRARLQAQVGSFSRAHACPNAAAAS